MEGSVRPCRILHPGITSSSSMRGKNHESRSTDYVANNIPHQILLLRHIRPLRPPFSLENFIRQYIWNLTDVCQMFEPDSMSYTGKCELRPSAHHHPMKLEESRQTSD